GIHVQVIQAVGKAWMGRGNPAMTKRGVRQFFVQKHCAPIAPLPSPLRVNPELRVAAVGPLAPEFVALGWSKRCVQCRLFSAGSADSRSPSRSRLLWRA